MKELLRLFSAMNVNLVSNCEQWLKHKFLDLGAQQYRWALGSDFNLPGSSSYKGGPGAVKLNIRGLGSRTPTGSRVLKPLTAFFFTAI
jgi:hypothetical protein